MMSYMKQVYSFANKLDPIAFSIVKCHSRKKRFWSLPPRTQSFGRYEHVKPLGHLVEDPPPPIHCLRPPYATGDTCEIPKVPERKTPADVERLRRACQLARRLLNGLRPLAKVGTTTEELNKVLWIETTAAGAYPSPLRYCGYPRSVCTSVNNVAVHGIPDSRPLHDGDIITVDVSVYLDGFHGDCADTWLVGDVDEQGRELVKVVYECLQAGMSVCKPGVPFAAIGCAIEKKAKAANFTVVPAFLGHGIGTYFHGPPDIYHFANSMTGCMDSGMTFTIEPVVAQGSRNTLILEDGWTAVMEDGSRAAQAENTVLITDDGFEILTK